jgi:hypothetical protein
MTEYEKPGTTAADDDECNSCADCAAPRDSTWPLGSDVCGPCWDKADGGE